MSLTIMNIIKGFAVALALLAPETLAHAQDFEASVKTVAQDLGKQMKERNAQKVAVVGFSDINGFESALGDFLSEELVTSLFGVGDFDVVERRELDRVMSEQRAYDPDLYANDSLVGIGKLLGVDVIISGTITDLGSRMKLNSRAISVESGKIFGASSASFPKDEMIDNLMAQPSVRGASATRDVPGLVKQPASIYFRNRWVQILPRGVVVQSARRSVRVSAEMKNVSNEPICIARNSKGDNIIISDLGESGKEDFSGLRFSYFVNTPEFNSSNCSMLLPGAATIVSWTLSSNQPIEGSKITIGSTFILSTPNTGRSFTARLKDIQIN